MGMCVCDLTESLRTLGVRLLVLKRAFAAAAMPSVVHHRPQEVCEFRVCKYPYISSPRGGVSLLPVQAAVVADR